MTRTNTRTRVEGIVTDPRAQVLEAGETKILDQLGAVADATLLGALRPPGTLTL